jgi:hypothetical protein
MSYLVGLDEKLDRRQMVDRKESWRVRAGTLRRSFLNSSVYLYESRNSRRRVVSCSSHGIAVSELPRSGHIWFM